MNLLHLIDYKNTDELKYIEIYKKYSDSELIEDINEGLINLSKLKNHTWIAAIKVYLLRNPIDTEIVANWRNKLGYLWLHLIRNNDNDWEWMITECEYPDWMWCIILGILPIHPSALKIINKENKLYPYTEIEEININLEKNILCFINKYKTYLLNDKYSNYGEYRFYLISLYFKYSTRIQKYSISLISDIFKCTTRTLWTHITNGLNTDIKKELKSKKPISVREIKNMLNVNS